jgi:hypothetical protein
MNIDLGASTLTLGGACMLSLPLKHDNIEMHIPAHLDLVILTLWAVLVVLHRSRSSSGTVILRVKEIVDGLVDGTVTRLR